MVKIGSFSFDYEKREPYGAHKIAEILYDTGSQLIGTTIMYNNKAGWGMMNIPSKLVKRDGKAYAAVNWKEVGSDTGEDMRSLLRDIEKDMSESPLFDITEELEPLFRKRSRRVAVNIAGVIGSGSGMELLVTGADGGDDSEEEVDRGEFVAVCGSCLEACGVNTFKDLQRVARIAKEMYQESVGTDDDPFWFE